MVTVGILVRVESGAAERVAGHLETLAGVSTLALEEADSIGAVIQADSAEQAEALLRGQIEQTPGVLCAWPVQIELGEAAPVPLPAKPNRH